MKQFLLALCVLAMLLPLRGNCQTKTQTALVRTRVTSDMKGGAPIAGAEVKMKDGNRHTSGKDGRFSFPVRGKFEIESATKEGYVMIDPKYLKNFTTYSENAIPVIMEERSKLNRETIRQTQRINKQLSDENERLMQLNDSLLKANAITEAKYDSLEQARGNDYLNKIDMVREMAEAFANIDYEILEEYDRQVYRALSEGDFVRAFELLKSHKSVEELKQEIADADAAIKATEEMLSSAKQGRDAKVKEAADQCYRWYEYYKARFMNDSAAYYLEQRATLDTNNIEWQLDVGGFYQEYLAQYDKALSYFYMANRQDPSNAKNLNNIGAVYYELGDTESALSYFNKALIINDESINSTIYNHIGLVYDFMAKYNDALIYFKKSLHADSIMNGANNPSMKESFNNIGIVYFNKGEYEMALDNYNKALSLSLDTSCLHYLVTLNNIGNVYTTISNFDLAERYYQRALAIGVKIVGEKHPSTATTYDNLGVLYSKKGDLEKAMECHVKAMKIYKDVLGENSLSLSYTYNNIAGVFMRQKNYDSTIVILKKSLNIKIKYYGSEHPSVGTIYNNIGYIYDKIGDYDKALGYYEKSLEIDLKYHGENHPSTGSSYNNIGGVYLQKKDFAKALELSSKALHIFEHYYGESHPETVQAYRNIGYIYKQLSDYEKSLDYYKKALFQYEKRYGENDKRTVKIRTIIETIEKNNE